LPLPPRPDDPSDREAALRYLGVTCSHPDWLVERWLDRCGFAKTERWLQFNNASAPLTLSVNRLRSSRDGVRAALASDGVLTEPLSFAPHGLRVVEGNPLRRPSLGRFLVQDEASQLVPLVVDARSGEKVLDVCAAPGGKTILMSCDMRDTGVLAACDVRPRRVALLRRTVGDAGSRHAHAVHVATDGPLPFGAVFDRVLVDAPCSGLGTVRRDPDIKWKRREGDLAGLAGRQLSLLQRASRTVGPRGRLVYATCSSEPEENEMVVDAFLAAEPAFRLIDLRAGGQPALAPVLDARGLLRTLPFAHGLEAFFGAAMERR
jgi:16S rRNA (cytosine967-C5)-methyltransferase